MKILFTSDLHGEISLYEQLLRGTQSYSAEVMVLGGDLLPSFPPKKRYEEMISNQKNFIYQYLRDFFKKLIDIVKLNHLFLIPGNWDLAYFHLFKEPIDGLIDITLKKYRLDNGYEILGYPFVPPTPFRPKDFEKRDDENSPLPPQKNPSYIRASEEGDELVPIDPFSFFKTRETIEEDLKRIPKPNFLQKTIYVTHSPPFGTCLDQIKNGGFAGSRSLRTFIEKTQPILTLHGHIHESPELSGSYIEKIGKTIAINPGQFTSPNLHMITFEIEDIERTLSHSFFSKPSRGFR
ncbi:MAG: metallophosphoesterase family protein [Thermodesulfobacteriota bacterium]